MSPAQFPEKLEFLFQPARYKVAYGGRASAKSWNFARALLLKGVAIPLRILCAREVQKSIRDSVHKLLEDQIQLLGLGQKYTVLESEIRGGNGTEFIFAGLSALTIESIKSYEGCDIVWVEEGQVISERSWKILTPTIRKEGSEIWVTLNPELESDPTYQMFVVNPPEGAIVVHVNWRDNPFFNAVMEKERLDCLTRFPDDYQNIWEGKCRPAVEGAIFFSEVAAMESDGRICNVPYDSQLKAHVVLDLGFGHAMAVAIVQVLASEIRVIWYREFFNEKLSAISSDLKGMRYNWGKVWLPHADGFSKTRNGQDSAYDIMRGQGWDCAKKSDVSLVTGKDEGIRVTRERFPRMYWDKIQCSRLVECAKRYRRSVNKVTLVAGSPLNDEYADGGDTIRYIAINANSMDNDTGKRAMPRGESYQPLDMAVGY